MKKTIAVILALILCIGILAGCGSSSSSSSSAAQPAAASDDTVTVGVLVVTTQSQWCNDIVTGVTQVCEANGAKVIVSDSQVSVDNEISGMENLINAGCKAIVVNAMNPGGLADACKAAQDKGIYIIGWTDMLVNYDALVVEDKEAQSNLVADAISAYLSSKSLSDAEMAAIWLADAANPDTNAGQYKAVQEGVFQSRLGNVKVVSSQFAADTNAAMNTAEAIVAANPNVKVLFTQSDEMGVGVAQVLQAQGVAADNLFVIGLDGTDEAIKNVADPNSSLSATVYVDTVTLGNDIGESIFAFLKDGTKGDVVTEYTLIDASNAAQYVK